MERRHYLMIACAVLARECYHCAALSPNLIDIKILEQGLHDVGEDKMSSALQREIDAAETHGYEAILLAYGLCNNGIRGLRATIPLVVPRAHDCITLLMGSKERYQTYFDAHPGTYYRSSGWMERAGSSLSNPDSTTKQMGMGTYEEYVAKYGEENAEYLIGILGNELRNYRAAVYIDTGLDASGVQQREAAEWAAERELEYGVYPGSVRLIQMAMDGEWCQADFLVVAPGHTIDASFDGGVIRQV